MTSLDLVLVSAAGGRRGVSVAVRMKGGGVRRGRRRVDEVPEADTRPGDGTTQLILSS